MKDLFSFAKASSASLQPSSQFDQIERKEIDMSRLNKLFLISTISALFCFAVQAVNAQTVIVGPNNDLSRYPIGLDPASASSAFPDFAAGGIYQQVYAAGAFSGPITITKIAFASSSNLTSGPVSRPTIHWTEHYGCQPKQSQHQLCGKQRQ
jgi:hypothetical protein